MNCLTLNQQVFAGKTFKDAKINLSPKRKNSYASWFRSPSGPDKVTFRVSDDKKPTFEGRFFVFLFLEDMSETQLGIIKLLKVAV
jgi:hypothetical protein